MASRRRILAVLTAAILVALAAFLFWPEPAPGPTGAWLQQPGYTVRQVEVKGARLRLLDAGQGPAVVLLHGMASSLFTWKDVLPALTSGHRVIAVDLPPFGGSSLEPALSPADYPELVPGVLDQLGLPAAALAGNSFGGAVALATAVLHRERVGRLVLIDAAAYNFAPGDRPFLLRLPGLPVVGPVFRRLPVRRRAVTLALHQVFHDPALVTPQRVDEYVQPLLRPGAQEAMAALLGRADDLGLAGMPPRVRVPTLVIWGRDDRWIPLRDGDRLTREIPGASQVVIPDCGHMPQEERPQEVARLLRGFLGAPDAAKPGAR